MNSIERVAKLLEPGESAGVSGAEHVRPMEQLLGTTEQAAKSEAKTFAGQLSALERSAIPETWEKAVRGADETNTPVIAEERPGQTLRINRMHLRRQGLITPNGERTINAENFRRIKRQILAKMNGAIGDAPSNLVMVTSAVPQEGKTFCAVNLAISLALEMDRTVLLVDADVAKPSVPGVLGVTVDKGLLDVLSDRNLDLSEVLCRTDVGKLSLLPAGSRHQYATELLASDAMGALLREMARRYSDRIIVFDSPPLMAASEASALAARMGQILVVVEAGRTSESLLKSALARIDTAKITGLLLNKGDDTGKDYGEYGYHA